MLILKAITPCKKYGSGHTRLLVCLIVLHSQTAFFLRVWYNGSSFFLCRPPPSLRWLLIGINDNFLEVTNYKRAQIVNGIMKVGAPQHFSHSQTAFFFYIQMEKRVWYTIHRKSCAGTYCYLGWVIIKNGFSIIGDNNRFLEATKMMLLRTHTSIIASKKQLLSPIIAKPFSIITHPQLFLWMVYQTLFLSEYKRNKLIYSNI